MKICEKLTVKDGWVNGFTHHRNGNHGGPLTTPAVKGLLEYTMVGNLRHAGAMFTPGTENTGNSAHFGTAQDGTVIQWVQLGVVAFHAFDANFHWYAVENADNGDPNNPYTDAQLSRIAQILELTSRPEYGRSALQVTGSPDQEGLGTHRMGGAAWAPTVAPTRTKDRITLARGPAPRSCGGQ
jgi:hypothetical protein